MLDQIEKPADRPVICTISGNAGLGKTSLAATFPKPIFIRIEDGLQSIPLAQRPDAFPLVQTIDQLWSQLMALMKEKHDYKTVVIDSVTQLEPMFVQHILDNDENKPKSINQALGGYGAGYSALSGLHGRVRKAAGILNDKGMNVVFIAHADTETLDLPDKEPYNIYTIRMQKKSVQHYIDNVDIVGFLQLETFVKGKKDKEIKKAISDGSRIITCYAVPSSVAKNRYGITEDLPFEPGKNPFIGILPTMPAAKQPEKK